METPNNIVCLYSSYSEASKKFLDKMNKNGIDFVKSMSIDNVHVRKLVNKKLKSVPTVVITYPSGNVELFEGQKAHDWIDEIITNKIAHEKEEERKRQEAAELERKRQEEERRQQEAAEAERRKQQEASELERRKQEETEQKTTTTQSSSNKFTSIDDVMDRSDERQGGGRAISRKGGKSVAELARELEKAREEMPNKKPI